MKIDIVTCFESNEERVRFIYEACASKGYTVNIITSDFSHIRKKKRKNIPENYIAVKTIQYYRNISLRRILSHRKFAKEAFKIVSKHKPDLLWVMAPANSLIKEASYYKNKNNVKLIIDIIDMWPESLPIKINKNAFPFYLWRNLRKNYINCADCLVTECNLYKDTLYKEYKNDIETIYWARESEEVNISVDLPQKKLSLCYIGSINNIIDIDRIYELIVSCDIPVIFYVIGEGEKTDVLLKKLDAICSVVYCGPVWEKNRKKEIFKKCHAGINIYKENLYIGLTVKCIDYFENGLPIINNIKGDTWNFVEKNSVGINVRKDTRINSEEIINMRARNQNVYDLYNENFTKKVFIEKCLKVIDEALK